MAYPLCGGYAVFVCKKRVAHAFVILHKLSKNVHEENFPSVKTGHFRLILPDFEDIFWGALGLYRWNARRCAYCRFKLKELF